MGMIKTWFKSSSPIVKVMMAISITSALVVLNKFYAPYSRKKRYLEAEEWANMIMEKEEAMKESAETQ